MIAFFLKKKFFFFFFTRPNMIRDAPPTCGAESSEWVFAAVHCSILPELSMCICPSLDQHGHMHGGA